MTVANESPTVVPSLRDIRDKDPYVAYELAREKGNVVWDEGMHAWLVLDYEGCAMVERREDLFAEPTGHLPGADVMTGPHEFRLLTGEPHRTLHHYLSARWAPNAIEPYREAFIRPVINARLERIRSLGRAELWTDFASLVPIAVIIQVIGLPTMEDNDLRRVKTWIDAVLAWRHTYGGEPSIVSAAMEATRSMEELLLPVIIERRQNPAEDLISGLWSVGPSIAAGWNERDVLDNIKPLFEAGAETTALLICTGARIALGDAALQERIKSGGEPLNRFVDEVLRHTTPVHWRARVATADVQLGKVTIRAGDRVHPVNAAANRDPARFRNPQTFDIDRPGYRSHLAFNAGPRHCAGAWLARFEAYEALTGILQLPGLRLDPDAETPYLSGLVLRTYRPLRVVFDV